MNYELAKQLKDAGFLLEKVGYGWNGNKAIAIDDIRYYAPTLSELIEACGDGFMQLLNLKGSYHALNCMFDSKDFKENKYLEGTGNTPEEAVAKLWLALNN